MFEADIIVPGKCPIEADGKCPLKPKGKWIETYKDINCSICGKIALSWNAFGTYVQVKSDFCPHCGARMEN